MHIQTLLNHKHPIKGWKYTNARFTGKADHSVIEIDVVPFRRNHPKCSVCGTEGPIYDHCNGEPRRFLFVPLWAIIVVLVYTMRRVQCPKCQRVVVEQIPWADGKSRTTNAMLAFLATWAKRMSWSETGRCFKVGWDTVYRAVEWAVEYGRAHVDLTGITAIGVDEIARGKWHKYVTLVYQIDAGCRRLLWVGKDRQEETLKEFFVWFGKSRTLSLRYVCSDMWKPYLNIIASYALNALHILDRFHIVSNLGKAVDTVRRQEVATLKAQGRDAVLVKSRWILLKKPSNLTGKQRRKRDSLIKLNLRSIRAYLLRLEFEHLWSFSLPTRAGQFLDDWCRRAMRSRLDPFKKLATTFRKHRELILNYFEARKLFSSGVVEGLNNKARVGWRRAYGFRGDKTLELALFHEMGCLPEPPVTHRFAG